MSKEARLIFFISYFLMGWGLVMIYSSSAVMASQDFQKPWHFLSRQIVYAFMATLGFLLAASIPVRFYRRHARLFMLLSILFLLSLFLPMIGHTAGGARRWIRLIGFQIQPVEFVKLACCIYLSDYLARKSQLLQKGLLVSYFPPMILLLCICGLLLAQPDLGSVAFLVLLLGIMVFLSGVQMRYIFSLLLVLVPTFYFLIVKVPYRLLRLQAYLNPWDDPQGKGFQMIQSLLAFALGGVKGVGLGEGTQKLFYLPSIHNDFILAVVGEELGLIGVLVIVLCFLTLFICGLRMAFRTQNIFERMLCISITLMFIFQAMIHMMVATGLTPTKGLPLPLMSYGGSSLLANLMSIGVLMSVDQSMSKSSKVRMREADNFLKV